MPRFTLSSHSGSNLLSSCTVFKTEATTRVFTVAVYSQCARKLAGSVLEFDGFRLGDRAYRLKVYPAGFDEESAGFVAVVVTMEDHWDSFLLSRSDRTILVEILDKDWERAVFDNNTARSEQTLLHLNRSKGYVRFVARRDLDESTCVRDDDSFTVRCTLSMDVEVTTKLTYPRPPPEA